MNSRAKDRVFLFSACLLGVRCRYDGGSSKNTRAEELYRKEGGLVICPEELGGLPTPRERAFVDFLSGERRVVSGSGKDVTPNFIKGRDKSMILAKEAGVTHAVLKDKSPSCGVKRIHTREGVIKGCGLTAEALRESGVIMVSDEDLGEFDV